MPGETNLQKLLQTMQPKHNKGEYVFCTVKDVAGINHGEIILLFREEEGCTIVVTKQTADALALDYSFVAAWITLTVHSSLEAVGLTAAFSNALANAGISCNVVAAYYHDHIFVGVEDVERAMEELGKLAG